MKRQGPLAKAGAPNCWEFNNCPEPTRLRCPAYPDNGRECWKVTGTQCAEGRDSKKSLSEKILYCRNECLFYKKHLRSMFP